MDNIKPKTKKASSPKKEQRGDKKEDGKLKPSSLDKIDNIEELQKHENAEIYEKAMKIIETYFNDDDDEEDAAIAAQPAQDNGMYGFGMQQPGQPAAAPQQGAAPPAAPGAPAAAGGQQVI